MADLKLTKDEWQHVRQSLLDTLGWMHDDLEDRLKGEPRLPPMFRGEWAESIRLLRCRIDELERLYTRIGNYLNSEVSDG